MKYLFVKDRLAWPRSSGHDVHASHMMRALGELGHEVALASVEPAAAEAVNGLGLARVLVLGGGSAVDGRVRLTTLQERFRSYWGVDRGRIAAVRDASDLVDADVVVVVGLGVLPYLGAIDGPTRVWYAGDEWVWHHLSQVRAADPSSWPHLRDAAVKGLYERAYAGLIDRAWVVSEADRRALRPLIGRAKAIVVPNGVDADHYQAQAAVEHERSCVFWGRLDFGPNVQALEWFCRKVWPAVRRLVHDARFTIYGFHPTDRVTAMAAIDGVSVVADLPDLRDAIARQPVVVLPFVSGGGIKNKLLEAASLARAIVGSPVALNGLQGLQDGRSPFLVARTADEWAEALASLWGDPGRRRRLGEEARRWVLANHSWEAAARAAVAGLPAATEAEAEAA
jgi:glycosyltransferase involved in cell wall biosynthesis